MGKPQTVLSEDQNSINADHRLHWAKPGVGRFGLRGTLVLVECRMAGETSGPTGNAPVNV